MAATLFTDIVGSTDMNAAMGDARWSALLDRHDRIVRELVEQWQGRWVKSTGDGVLAVFDGPARALRATLAARERLAELGIRIRAGVHCERDRVAAATTSPGSASRSPPAWSRWVSPVRCS